MTPHEYDRLNIWHPYASLGNPPPVRFAKSAHGTRIVLENGKELIDSVSSWWCVAHGHNHPHITEAIRRQSEKLSHVMFGGFTHEPAVELARRLAAIAPEGLDKIFFADSGSIAVEVAVKMCIQYQHALGRPGRCKMLALKGGYHGDTACAMALSDPDGMHTLFAGMMPKHHFAAMPGEDLRAWDFREVLERHKDEIAGVICEPIFQAANAMNFYDAEYLREMRKACDEYGILLVFDEIAAGFYRTGPRWAHERSGIKPDIMTVGKALTGGHITLAATLASGEVADVISRGSPSAFMHGPTYMANPLACAAGIASIELFGREDYSAKAEAIGRIFREEGLPQAMGAVGVIKVPRLPARADIDRIIDSSGVWLRPFANFIYAMPPLVTPESEVRQIAAALKSLAACPPDSTILENGDFHE